MSRDKEFKSKPIDENYVKKKKANKQFGEDAVKQSFDSSPSSSVSQSKKNRKYQSFQKENEAYSPTATTDNALNADTQNDYEVSTDNSQDTNTQNNTAQEFGEPFEMPNYNSNNTTRNIYKGKNGSGKTRFYQKHYTANNHKSVDTSIYENDSSKPSENDDTYSETSDTTEEKFTYDFEDTTHHSSDNREFGDNKPDSEFKRSSDSEFSDKGSKFGISTKENHIDQKSKFKKKMVYDGVKKKNSEEQTDDFSEDTKSSQNTEPIGEKSKESKTTDAEFGSKPKKSKEFVKYEKYQNKADKAADKFHKAQENLPHKKKLKKKRVYDEQRQKPKTILVFENEIKKQSEMGGLQFTKKPVSFVGYEATNCLHNKISTVEKDNSAVEAAHSTEKIAEEAIFHLKHKSELHRRNKPYVKAEKLKFKAEKLEKKAYVKKFYAENPEMQKKSAVQKAWQKNKIKKQYQKVKQAEERAKKTKKAVQETKKVSARIASFVWRHKKVFVVLVAIILLISWLMGVLSSCSIMGTTGANSLMVSSYFAEDNDIYAAEDYYVGLEQNLQNKINNIESQYSGYDEYKYNVAGIGHNPYELISYLTAVYQDFTFNGIKNNLDTLFNEQYHLIITETSEQRSDGEGGTYTYKILNVTLTNSGFTPSMNEEQQELYAIYLLSKGNRDYLFADDIYSNITQSPYDDYTIPGEALNDETFKKLITEAEKYLGYPYVWGGSSPSTSFDCSGFVCWVYRNSGVYPLSRTTAQGVFNQCSAVRPSEAKPGDLIFFTGTYNSGCPVSHIGIYVGNGMMIHCGNPIQYASVNSSYWSSHFYAYGRLGSN